VASGAGGSARPGTGGASAFACDAPVSPPALLTDFSPAYWMNTTGKWGMVPFQGNKYSFASPAVVDGGLSTSTANVDIAVDQQNLNVMATVVPGAYAGFGLLFDQCATVAAYSGVRFSMQGSTGGCALELQLETYDQRPGNQSPPGGCDRDAGVSACLNYPVAHDLPTPANTADWITVDVPFSSVTGWSATAAGEIVGLQWQLTLPAGGAACAANFRIDDVQFVP